MTIICVSKLTTIGSDNSSSPGRRQAIIWTNATILLIGSLGTNFNNILIKIPKVSFKKMRSKGPSAKWLPCCRSLNVLTFSSSLSLVVSSWYDYKCQLLWMKQWPVCSRMCLELVKSGWLYPVDSGDETIMLCFGKHLTKPLKIMGDEALTCHYRILDICVS